VKYEMKIDLTDWAALLEALDGVPGNPPPLPNGFDPWRVAPRALPRRRLHPRYRPSGQAMSLSQ
jgi:hypothetical protein